MSEVKRGGRGKREGRMKVKRKEEDKGERKEDVEEKWKVAV